MEFIERISKRPDIAPYASQIESFAGGSGCSLKIEILDPRCGGISIPGECIIAEAVLLFPKELMLYIILHEIAHQYQYRKHGRDMMIDAYLNLPIDDAAEELIRIESVADRMAMLKLRSMIGTRRLPPYRYYGCQNKGYFRSYLERIRTAAESMGKSDIDSINEMIYAEYRS